jgi:ribosomal-protein-alanine N-acetyltransferase
MSTPTLQTPRLLLRPFERSDAADVFAYASNPNVSRHTTWQTHRTIADADAFIEMILQRGPDKYCWAIRLADDPRVIGAIEFGIRGDNLGESGVEAEFHYVLGEGHWNRGLMTEAARAVLDWGLRRYPKVRRVVTYAMTENRASQRVMEKCGLKFVGVHQKKWAKFAGPVELSEYAMDVPGGSESGPR